MTLALWLLPLFFASFLPAGGDGSSPDHSDVATQTIDGEAQFFGRWKVAKFISSSGQPSAVSARYAFVFSPGKLEWFDGDGKHLHSFETTFDADKSPKQFTLLRKVGERERRALGVYDFRDGQLHLYYVWDKARPTKLERPDGGFIYVIQRAE
jgi:uncharacterized protein (TIGR03067 family)